MEKSRIMIETNNGLMRKVSAQIMSRSWKMEVDSRMLCTELWDEDSTFG
jgi:hypothetical protein